MVVAVGGWWQWGVSVVGGGWQTLMAPVDDRRRCWWLVVMKKLFLLQISDAHVPNVLVFNGL